jgi:hypothetical protein
MKHLWGIAALVLLTGCAATPPPPAPTPDNSIFLTQYRTRFLGGTDDAGVRIGHYICDDYRAGTSFRDEVTYLMSKNAAFTAGDVGFLIGASTSAYCPEFNNRH